MSKSSEIRIPRTTAMFVTNLGQILREHFELNVTVHEQWTFEKVASWEECLQKGECHTHGISAEFQDRLDANPHDQSLWWADCQFPYKFDIYLAKGWLRAGADAVEVRARITAVQNVSSGDMYTAEVWVKEGDQAIQRGHFWLDSWFDHSPMGYDNSVSTYPPDKIAFWRKPEETKKHNFVYGPHGRRVLTTREKRIARQKFLLETTSK